MTAVLNRSYILPLVRGADSHYDPSCDEAPPFPLTTFVSDGHFPAWRHMVWRSLLAYEPRGLRYDCLDAFRLIEIQFERDHTESSTDEDVGYRSLRELQILPLLVLVIPELIADHRSFPTVIGRVVGGRRDEGRPTWVFTHLRGAALYRTLGAATSAVGGLFASSAVTHWSATRHTPITPTEADAPTTGDTSEYADAATPPVRRAVSAGGYALPCKGQPVSSAQRTGT